MEVRTIGQLFDLSGKAAIVTGGAMGIGQAIAFRLAEAGAGVLITDIDAEAANTTAAQVVARGLKARAIESDIANVADAKRVIATVVETFGTLDILVNNAGIYPLSSALRVDEQMWDRVHNVNLKGLFFLCKAAAEEMIREGRPGKIVNIASVDAFHPTRGTAHYSASKGGVAMATKALALELAPHSILVNAIAPGPIASPGNKGFSEIMRTDSQTRERFMSRLPLGRVGEPDEIAKVALCLVSQAADYMTGSVVLVDGGYLLS